MWRHDPEHERRRDEFIAAAPRHELETITRAETDAAFATLAEDPDHQAETRTLDAEFAGASWEALRVATDLPGQ
jgi:hypothetical protein